MKVKVALKYRKIHKKILLNLSISVELLQHTTFHLITCSSGLMVVGLAWVRGGGGSFLFIKNGFKLRRIFGKAI